MSWWGKVIGGTVGFFFLGGPLGAVLGAAMGHNFDARSARGRAEGGASLFGSAQTERIQSAFFTATFSIMGALAKADGQVSQVEIRLAEDLMSQMRLNPQQKKVAINLFQEGKKSDFPMDDMLEQFRRECMRRTSLIQMFMEIQIAIALADGEYHPEEKKLLEHIASRLGITQSSFKQLFDRIRAQQHFHKSGGADPKEALKDAYTLLGIKSSAEMAEVKKAYRRQMNQHHPDKLVAKGLPQEMIDVANKKTQDIRDAYELIKKHH